MSWFRRNDKPGVPAAVESPVAAAERRPSLLRLMGVVRLFRRTKKMPEGTGVSTTVITEPLALENPATLAPARPLPASRPAARSAWRKCCDGLSGALEAIDRAMNVIAVPFGVHVRETKRRYVILLGVFSCLFVVGALPVPYLPLMALLAGYVGVLAIGRAWVANEHERAAIVKKLKHGNPDELPDLRGSALVSALMLFVLFPLAFMQIHRHSALFAAAESATFFDWLWFALDKTYLKALPDWSILYGVHVSSIDFNGPWGRHLVLLSRLTFDFVLLQGLYRLLAIRATIREAVAVIKTDPDVAVRVGRRAIPSLVDKLSDPDRAVRGAAANALTQLGDPEGMKLMSEALADDAGRTAGLP